MKGIFDNIPLDFQTLSKSIDENECASLTNSFNKHLKNEVLCAELARAVLHFNNHFSQPLSADRRNTPYEIARTDNKFTTACQGLKKHNAAYQSQRMKVDYVLCGGGDMFDAVMDAVLTDDKTRAFKNIVRRTHAQHLIAFSYLEPIIKKFEIIFSTSENSDFYLIFSFFFYESKALSDDELIKVINNYNDLHHK